MSVQAILLPLFVEVILTFVLLFWLASLRIRDLNAGIVQPEAIALREPNWPAHTTQVANAFANQFELPLLFYLLIILQYVTHTAGVVFVVLAWVFVLFRCLHAFVHVTSNVVRRRGSLFGVTAFVLAVMWLIFIIEALTLPRPI